MTRRQQPRPRQSKAPTRTAEASVAMTTLLGSPLVVLAALVAFLATQYRYALRAPFVADDFLFVKKTQSSDFLSLWSPSNLAFSYYRPWSREFHYWSLIHLFGFQQVPFHVVSFALAATSGLLFFLLARKI